MSKVKAATSLLAIALGAVLYQSTPALAFCTRSFGIDFEGKLNAELNYLICLHNEQSDALNRQARSISALADEVLRLEENMKNAVRKIEELESRLVDER